MKEGKVVGYYEPEEAPQEAMFSMENELRIFKIRK